jgi:aryl-phospho-beta-D-glucosidase BglC (GH1 family)
MTSTLRALFYMSGFLVGSGLAHAQLDPAFVKTDGHVLRDQAGSGKILKLRGFNLGGWLFQESWMSPNLVNDPTATGGTRGAYQPEIDAILTQRFGRDVKNQLIRDFQNAWITTVDLDNLAAHGVNLVRVPFSYLTLMEEDGTWKPDAEAFDRLDWIVAQAWARGIYCILDFHNAQGGQDGSGFWSSPLYQDRAVQIWQKVAARYVGNPAVAGYDLLNEPMGASGSTQWNFVDRCYDAVRAIDPDHMVLVEAVWDLNALPKTTTYGWTNVTYSLHWYAWNQNSTQMMATLESDMAKLQANTDLGAASGKVVPYNIGEFSYWDSPDVWRRAMREFYRRNYSWTSWTYKTRNMGAWGLYNPNRPQPNLSTDTAEQISAKWTAYATASLTDARNSYLRDLISSPIAADDALTVPSGGNLVIPHSTLLANDGSQSTARSLAVADPGTPSHGTLLPLDAGNFLYVPAPGYTGTAEFTYLAFDNSNGLGSPRPATVTLTISAPPTEPVPYAVDDVHNALRDTPLTIAAPGLLANDGDLSARPLAAELVTAPSAGQGTVTLRPDGGFTFAPAAGFTGLSTFTYRPVAGTVAGAPATVSVRVASSAPSGQNGMTGEYYGTSTNWTGSFSTRVDPEINFSWTSTTGPGLGMPGTNYSVKWKGWITAPYSGTWTITETSDDAFGVYIDGVAVVEDWPAHGPREKSGTITLTGGQPRYLELYHINYGGGAVAKLEWSHPLVPRQVVPQAWLTTAAPSFPVLSPTETWRYGYFGTTSNSGNAADDADPDGDGFNNLAEFTAGTHPLSAGSVPTPNDTVPPVVSVPSDITLEATGPSGAVATFTTSALDDVSGVMPTVNTPASGSMFPLGASGVTATATDAAGNTGSAGFTVTVFDTTPPSITVPENLTVAASSANGAYVSFSTSASDLVDGSPAITNTPPSGALFPVGTTTVTTSASDATGNNSSRNFTVTVNPWNSAPEIAAIGDKVIAQGSLLAFTASATDTDIPSQAMTYSLDVGAPAGASIHATTGAFSWTPATSQAAGTYPVTIRVTDNGNPAKSDFETIYITVTSTLPSPWVSQNIGNVGIAGTSTYNSGTFTISGAGTGIGGTTDACNFVYQNGSGDCSVTVRVQSLNNTGTNAKVGVMIRESTAANAREAGVWVTPTGGIQFTRRSSIGGSTAVTSSTGKAAPYWVRLTRTGNTFKAYMSANGITWTQLGKNNISISMTTNTYIGLAVSSGSNATLCTGVMTNDQVTP